MFQGWSQTVRSAFDSILPLYRDTNFAYSIAAAMTAAALVLAIIAIVGFLVRSASLEARIRTISSFVSFGSKGADGLGADNREAQFASRFAEIDQRLQAGGPLTGSLAYAWKRYRKTFSFVAAPPIRSTQRPNSFLYAAVPPPTWLAFAASLFVAFGLLATFLGLVAALSFASAGMASDDVSAMQSALRGLLGAASSKFVTSVAGVGLSIVLRLLERLLTVALRSRIDRLSQALEFGIRVDADAHSAAVADRISLLVDRLAPAAETERS